MFSIQLKETNDFITNYNIPRYSIFLLEKGTDFSVNFVNYKTDAFSVLFLSPYQNFKWLGKNTSTVKLIEFHGDFYCIEYHKKEVACNGLLFNNIYLQPYISVSRSKYEELENLIDKMTVANEDQKKFSDSILKSYLQLILALCSQEKATQIDKNILSQPFENEILHFQSLLEKHFVNVREPSFYAGELKMSPSSFSKKIKLQFGKTPTQLIQERVVLEAKKLLHLTKKSVKEVAAELHFDDEHYFSRYFKNEVSIAPTQFREEVGISVVAK